MSDLNAARFHPEQQGQELLPQFSRKVMLDCIRVLAAHDALDLVPMLFAPMNPHTQGRRV